MRNGRVANSAAIATWQEFPARIAAGAYSFETGAWSEPLTVMVTSKRQIDNRAVAFNDTGAPVAYFSDLGSVSGDGQLKSVLADGVWGPPQTVAPDEISGATYSVTRGIDSIAVVRVHPRTGERALPALALARCEGY